MTDAREIRRALAAVAREMNEQPQDWQRLSREEHLALALEAVAHGELAAGCAALLYALEIYERERLATRDARFAADELAHRVNARRPR
jgi:hypothetical protein